MEDMEAASDYLTFLSMLVSYKFTVGSWK